MQTILRFYHQIPPEAWQAILGSGIVSVVLQNIKRWLSLQSDKVVHFLLIVLSFAAVAIHYLMGAASQNPKILGAQTFLILGLANTLYRFAIKPASNLLQDAGNERQRRADRTANDAAVSNVISPNLPELTPDYTATGSTGLTQGTETPAPEFDA